VIQQSIQYQTWIQYHHQQLLIKQQSQRHRESRQTCNTCDLLPFPRGRRYYWNVTLNQAIHVVNHIKHDDQNNSNNIQQIQLSKRICINNEY
jgi:hypothetical protein